MNGGAAVKYIGIALLIAAGFVLLTLGLAFLLFQLAFGARKTTEKEMFVLPDTDQYRPYAADARPSPFPMSRSRSARTTD